MTVPAGRQPSLPTPALRSVAVYVIPIAPSVNHQYGVGANGRRYLTERAQAWRTEAALLLRQQGFTVPRAERYCVGLHVFFPDKRRADIDNCLKLTLDLVAKEGGFDDAQIFSLLVEKGYSKDQPRIELKVSDYRGAA